MNPEMAIDVANYIKLAINAISMLILVALVPAIIGTLIFTIGRVIESQKD